MKRTDRLQKEKQLRKQLILDAAMKTFARTGYDKTTMNDIAREAGYSKANMYFYFKNKDEVLLELIRDEMKHRSEMTGRALAKKDPPAQKLGHFIEDAFDYIKEHSDLIRILHSEQNKLSELGKDEKFRKELMADQMGTIDAISKILEEGVKAGDFNKMDTRETGILLMGMVGTSIMFWFHSGMKNDLDKSRKTIMDVLLRGISK